jgi:predicted transcriptional regulator
MLNKGLIKIIGLLASLLGIGASLVSDWVSEKKMDEKIAEKVAEAFAKGTKKMGS